jgi:hypothetical protein
MNLDARPDDSMAAFLSLFRDRRMPHLFLSFALFRAFVIQLNRFINQARIYRHCRYSVRSGIPSTAAVSSIVRPVK